MPDKVKPLTDESIESLRQLAHLMDHAFAIPGTNIRFGVDAILGLVPVIGDTIGLAISGYIFSFAKRSGVPWYKRLRMAGNIFLDWLIGLIPFVGDLFDVGWKANKRNIEIIASHYEKHKNADVIEGTATRLS